MEGTPNPRTIDFTESASATPTASDILQAKCEMEKNISELLHRFTNQFRMQVMGLKLVTINPDSYQALVTTDIFPLP